MEVNLRNSFLGCLAIFFTLSCSPKKTPNTENSSSVEDGSGSQVDTSQCVQIFYDQHTPSDESLNSESGSYGLVYARMTANLLSHFQNLSRTIIPMSQYKKGQLESCDSNIFLGSDYYSDVPKDFIEDFLTTKKRVAWLGYSFWDLDEKLESVFGVRFDGFTEYDSTHLAADGKPSFFRDVLYKGETFSKFNEMDSKGNLQAAFEISRLKIIDSSKSQVLAEIQNSGTQELLPWALKSENKFLVTEIPLSYIHEGDRYLVFADLLYDFLGREQISDKHPAVLRLEDIHSKVDLKLLDKAVAVLKSENVPIHLSIIPAFKDPFGSFLGSPVIDPVPFSQEGAFLESITHKVSEGAQLIWHGVTHQYNDQKNPFSGTTADDFEFWDAVKNSPIQEDSNQYIKQKLDFGAQIFAQAKLKVPEIWITPHYQASALDNLFFAKYFKWNMGRILYFNFDPLTQKQTKLPVGQFFPYIIYGDVYGQRVVPENLGNVQNEINEQVKRIRTVDMILSDAKRNRVLRDSWASVFYHPYMMDESLNHKDDLLKLVKGLKDLGYQFVQLDNYLSNEKNEQPALIERINLK